MFGHSDGNYELLQKRFMLGYRPSMVALTENASFQIFDVVIPTEGLAVEMLHQSFFWYDTGYRFVMCNKLGYTYGGMGFCGHFDA